MIVGDPSVLAVECGISEAYTRQSIRAIGFFVIHITGHSYGVRSSHATALACSRDEVERRVIGRGRHIAPFWGDDAEDVARSLLHAVYADHPYASYRGIQRDMFLSHFYRECGGVLWAPDGDQAFDDGSFVLQMDVHDQVRLIAFQSGQERKPDLAKLSDLWLSADVFYTTLEDWCEAFDATWVSHPKTDAD